MSLFIELRTRGDGLFGSGSDQIIINTSNIAAVTNGAGGRAVLKLNDGVDIELRNTYAEIRNLIVHNPDD